MLPTTFQKKIELPLNSEVFFCKINSQKFIVLKKANAELQYLFIPSFIKCKKQSAFLVLSCCNSLKPLGLVVFNNLILSLSLWLKGFEKPWKKQLLLKGLGFKAALIDDSQNLELKLGLSHVISFPIPTNKINIRIFKNTITVEGFDKADVGNFVNKLRTLRFPDSYKGKGFWYKNEIRTLKEVKKT